MSIIDSLLDHARGHTIFDGPLRMLSRHYINKFASAIAPRPRAFSLWSPVPTANPPDPQAPNYITDYSSWPGLTNKTFSGRHLAPAEYAAYTSTLPADAVPADKKLGDVTALFARGTMRPSRSSLLFPFFAQWFTDSILRVNKSDRRTNSSNHDIDLCQIYGLKEERCRVLREMKRGRLRSQRIKDEEFPDYLYERTSGGWQIRAPYRGVISDDEARDALDGFDPNLREKFYATGLERGNQSVGYVLVSMLFLREHNRLAHELAARNPTWDDERLFQTARVINIVILMKLVVEDYINHILGHHVFILDHEFAEQQLWYRANWIAIEFDMLYRWHGLAPDQIEIDGKAVHPSKFRNNNALLEQCGVAKLLEAVSSQPAGAAQIGNTPGYLIGAEYANIKMGRDFRIQPYNAYRKYFGLKAYKSFADFPCDPEVRGRLETLYETIDRMEYAVGIFAEQPDEGLLFGELLNNMVAYDAFTQIFSNPLLSVNVYGERTFTKWGLEQIESTTSIQALADRNGLSGVTASLAIQKPK
jgi:prostaglandin-endoperoxide synthase 2